jgi:hypothetical protein
LAINNEIEIDDGFLNKYFNMLHLIEEDNVDDYNLFRNKNIIIAKIFIIIILL